jgi:hypothetical protein
MVSVQKAATDEQGIGSGQDGFLSHVLGIFRRLFVRVNQQ